MAMERLLTSLVFCEAPLDFAYGAPAVAATGGARLVADARGAGAGDVPSRPAEGAAMMMTRRVSVKPAARWQAECTPAFDGLNCFETVVTPARSSSP